MLAVLGLVTVRQRRVSAAVPPAVYPLELVSPREAGTAPSADSGTPNMPSGHRIFKAYPGIPYEIRAVVIGGAYPYTFSLSGDVPSGMTIDATTGEIVWASPAADASPTITVTDSDGTVRSSTWDIVVTTAGFQFYSPTGNDSNAGTLASPRQTLNHARTNTAGDIVYFRGGTYTFSGVPEVSYGTGHTRTSWGNVRGSSVQLLAYPGETVIFDHLYSAGTHQGLMVDLEPESYAADAQPVYFDGIESFGASNCLWRLSVEGHYHTFRRMTFRDIWEPTEGDNPGGIMHVTTGTMRQYCTYQDNVGYDLDHGATCGLYKFYGLRKLLIEDNEAYTTGGPFDLKFATPRFEVRGCWFHDNAYIDQGIVGNQNGQSGDYVSGEVRFNRITGRGYSGGPSDAYVVNLNNFALTEQVDVYRNTLVGAIRIQPAASDTGGPFKFYNNVIINDNTGHPDNISYDNPVNTGLVELGAGAAANVVGAEGSGVVNEAGDLALIGASRTAYLGTHGHEIAEGGGSPASGPVRLRIRGGDDRHENQ